MALISIRGVQIKFPYEPYKVQEDYMEKVIECLQQEVNGILESPTGTGKTLSLLCSSLAWLEGKKAQHQLLIMSKSGNNETLLNHLQSQLDNAAGVWSSPNFVLPKIIYTSRTHVQLSQAAQELKRTSYKHVRSVVLGSREQLCLHPEVSKMENHSAKVFACRAKIQHKSCPFYFNFEGKIASQDYKDNAVMDIEDVISLGKKHTCCPYYATRTLKGEADLLFSPYNYIIDPKTRRSQGIELERNIVIFDEAHNVGNACEESMSFQLRSLDLASCINEVTQTIRMLKPIESSELQEITSSDTGAPDFTITDLSILKVMFCELEQLLDKEIASNPNGISKPGDYMIDILSRVELVPEKAEIVIDLLDKICMYHSASATSPWGSRGVGLQKFCDIIKILFSKAVKTCSTLNLRKEYSLKYRAYLQYDIPKKSNGLLTGWTTSSDSAKQGWKLDCWCFSPEIGMQDVVNHGVHSIVLTSGTLSPLPPLVCELGVSFPVLLENPHIINDKQVCVGVVSQGPDGTQLNSSYQNRFCDKYINSLGRAISNFCRIIPDGVLAFFPSYTVMKSNVAKWEEMGIWQSLSAIKPVFVEPQGKDAFQESIDQFYSRINDPEGKGAFLLGVCRGKVSEGLDFADKNARGVIITGLPFPPSMDARVKMKMDYLNATAKETKGLYGTDWYVLQASRAINQAIGRVIRHKDDYGAILLCDNRFADKRIQGHLSRWVQGRIKVFSAFGPSLKHLSTFFKEIDPSLCRPKSQLQDTHLHGFSTSFSYPVPKDRIGTKQNVAKDHLNEKMNESSIFDGYLKVPNGTTPAGPSVSHSSSSIFDAIDHYEASSASSSCSSFSKPSNSEKGGFTKITSMATPESGGVKKRKINIELRGIDQPAPKNSAADWKTYLKEVKSILSSTEQYSRFCSVIKDFRTQKNTSMFAEQICEIFSLVPDKKKYLKKTSLLVSSQERENFLRICSLSGT